MAKTYNFARYKMSEYDLGQFPGPKAGEQALDFTLATPKRRGGEARGLQGQMGGDRD